MQVISLRINRIAESAVVVASFGIMIGKRFPTLHGLITRTAAVEIQRISRRRPYFDDSTIKLMYHLSIGQCSGVQQLGSPC